LHALDDELFFFRHVGLSRLRYQCTKLPEQLQVASSQRGMRIAVNEKTKRLRVRASHFCHSVRKNSLVNCAFHRMRFQL
jgi:hypothetical protein